MEKILAKLIDNLSLLYMTLENKEKLPKIEKRNLLPYFRDKYLKNPKDFYFSDYQKTEVKKELIHSYKEHNLYQLNFESPFLSPFPENNLVWGKYFKLKKNSRGVILVLHGWRIKNYMFFDSACKKFLNIGLDSIFLDLPYHLHRTPSSSYGGEYMISSDGVQTIESIRQAILEAKILIDWLREQKVKKIGLFGVSLGSWLSAILCTLISPPLDFAILVSPPANPEKMFYKSRIANLLKDSGGKIEKLFERFKKALRIVNPLYFQPLMKKDNLLVIENLYDQMVPVEVVEEFCASWGIKNILRYKQGHLSVLFFEKNFFPDIEKFIKKIV